MLDSNDPPGQMIDRTVSEATVQQTTTTKTNPTTDNAIKLLGEAFVPGASLLMDGQVASGAAHAVIGTFARVALGPVGLALVIANSFSKSATGKNLIKQFTGDKSEVKTKTETEVEVEVETETKTKTSRAKS